ncbi:hydrogenase maturation protease [Xanthobacteraceae bacterium Astr-EGSB]|uniref:hydrogenase maturation protease n=1 Tax=Astrobacterium formosum TaxID=3069710 RepID=UPI0027AF1695|nr:hydrogenase maturation protease [Xanthobacteraceae bacterium Astr-EGSB]
MPRILIIGYGNTLRGDDGFGPLAAEHVAARAPPGVEVMSVHQLGPELALDIRAADLVVFLDAAHGPDPGRLAAAPVVVHDLSPSSVTHRLDPGGLLALTRAVYGRVPAAALVTAIAADFAHGDTISAEVRNAAKKAAEVIVQLAESGHLDTQTLGEALS